jgi:hypothetical protein
LAAQKCNGWRGYAAGAAPAAIFPATGFEVRGRSHLENQVQRQDAGGVRQEHLGGEAVAVADAAGRAQAEGREILPMVQVLKQRMSIPAASGEE